jgi:ABC-type uncharacterized transport system permease subunit
MKDFFLYSFEGTLSDASVALGEPPVLHLTRVYLKTELRSIHEASMNLGLS